MLAESDASVATRCHNIDKLVIHHDFNPNLRMRFHEAIDDRRQDINHHCARHVEFQKPTHQVLGTSGITQRGTRFSHQWRDTGSKRASGFRWHDAACRADQQRHAQLRFKVRDPLAHGGGGTAATVCRRPENLQHLR
jgi:hypothetical protein